ncbi:hypothetical protein FQA39_LY03695 [Lamprigera yunnana]|nr:hypothetical protein FQA39_LY03695 [Lamprigera yunnana]
MKVVALLLAVFLQVSLQDTIRELQFKIDKRACLKEGNVTESLLKQSYKTGFSNDMPTKCFYKCILAKDNLMDVNGQVDLTPLKSRFTKAIEMLDGCAALKETNPCDLAFSVSKCIRNVFQTAL